MAKGPGRVRTGVRQWALATCLVPVALAGACSQAVSDAPTQAASSNAAQTEAVHPESGLPVIPVRVKTSSGVHRFASELARTRIEQAKGLMFRTAMGADEAMLFPFDSPRQAGFWMRNTVIPLDIVFIGADGRILNIAENAAPYSEDTLRSKGKAAAVLELNGGRAAQLGIKPGDKVEW